MRARKAIHGPKIVRVGRVDKSQRDKLSGQRKVLNFKISTSVYTLEYPWSTSLLNLVQLCVTQLCVHTAVLEYSTVTTAVQLYR